MAECTALHQQLTEFFVERLNLEVLTIDTDLVMTGVLDSLAFVELLAYLEEEFRVKISLDDIQIDNFRSIAKVAEFIAHRDSHISPQEHCLSLVTKRCLHSGGR